MAKVHASVEVTLKPRKEKITVFDRLCCRMKYSGRRRVGSGGFRTLVRQGGHGGPSGGPHATRG